MIQRTRLEAQKSLAAAEFTLSDPSPDGEGWKAVARAEAREIVRQVTVILALADALEVSLRPHDIEDSTPQQVSEMAEEIRKELEAYLPPEEKA